MNYFISVICLLLLSTYSKAQYLDEMSVKLHQPADLKKDVYLVQNTLEKENPNLYLYISKKDLDHKFDSLRMTIKQPLTSISLYVKLLSVISYIGDGHLTINIDYSKFTASDIAFLKKPTLQHPIYQFNYRVIAHRLFISENLSVDSTIAKGTEILSINDVPAAKLIDSLSHYITSDGYNTTYKEFLMNSGLFAERYRFLYPKREPLNFKLSSNKGMQQITLNAFQKPGYDSSSVARPPHTAYKLLTADSSIAYLKLQTFFNGANYEGYHGIFADIQKRKLKTLIIDLRGNTGGEIGWASSIYSFLIDTPTYFYKLPAEISRQKLLYDNPKIRDWVKKASKLNYPIVTPDTSIFKGKIYVLINGGSFSASSLLAANMRNLKNVTFVGEETGGSKNVWTAGIIKNMTLPTSKLSLAYGNMPAYFGDITNIDGRGLMPDVSISYTIEDYLANKDLEMDWVLKDIAR
ncbi:S41 family peptidase [Pedobacter panaciterrae]